MTPVKSASSAWPAQHMMRALVEVGDTFVTYSSSTSSNSSVNKTPSGMHWWLFQDMTSTADNARRSGGQWDTCPQAA